MLIFKIDDEQEQKLNEWHRSHNCEYRESDGRYRISSQLSSFGELETFQFVPTSIGAVVTTCKCACGETIDLTDYSVI